MNKNDKADVIDAMIFGRTNGGDSCVETAEAFMEDARSIDPQLYAALMKLMEGAGEMIDQLKVLNTKYNLGYNNEDI